MILDALQLVARVVDVNPPSFPDSTQVAAHQQLRLLAPQMSLGIRVARVVQHLGVRGLDALLAVVGVALAFEAVRCDGLVCFAALVVAAKCIFLGYPYRALASGPSDIGLSSVSCA